MIADDVSQPFGGSMQKAAAVVRARVPVIPSVQDHMLNPEPALKFAKLIHACVFKLTSDCGHLAVRCQAKELGPVANAFLRQR